MSRHIFVMPMVLYMALMYFRPQYSKWVKHDFLSQGMPLVPAMQPCDANYIINATISFIRDMTLLVMQCHWCWCQCHIMSTVSSMVPFHLLGQDDQNEMQHDLFDHVVPLPSTSASCYANGIINGRIIF